MKTKNKMKKKYNLPIYCPHYACGERGEHYYCYMDGKLHCKGLQKFIEEESLKRLEEFIKRARENGAI